VQADSHRFAFKKSVEIGAIRGKEQDHRLNLKTWQFLALFNLALAVHIRHNGCKSVKGAECVKRSKVERRKRLGASLL